MLFCQVNCREKYMVDRSQPMNFSYPLVTCLVADDHIPNCSSGRQDHMLYLSATFVSRPVEKLRTQCLHHPTSPPFSTGFRRGTSVVNLFLRYNPPRRANGSKNSVATPLHMNRMCAVVQPLAKTSSRMHGVPTIERLARQGK